MQPDSPKSNAKARPMNLHLSEEDKEYISRSLLKSLVLESEGVKKYSDLIEASKKKTGSWFVIRDSLVDSAPDQAKVLLKAMRINGVPIDDTAKVLYTAYIIEDRG